jgi:hypothetical protein
MDGLNHRVRVTNVSVFNQSLTTIAGVRGVAGLGDGPCSVTAGSGGCNLSLTGLSSFALSPSGTLFIADTNNCRLRMLTCAAPPPTADSCSLATLAGVGACPSTTYSGDGVPASASIGPPPGHCCSQ